jgi:hypothetical protein
VKLDVCISIRLMRYAVANASYKIGDRTTFAKRSISLSILEMQSIMHSNYCPNKLFTCYRRADKQELSDKFT